MKVQVEKEYLVITQVNVIEGNTCVVVTCHDFDHYKSLPDVVSYNGIKCGKTGWNSDTNHAHYQSNALMVCIDSSESDSEENRAYREYSRRYRGPR